MLEKVTRAAEGSPSLLEVGGVSVPDKAQQPWRNPELLAIPKLTPWHLEQVEMDKPWGFATLLITDFLYLTAGRSDQDEEYTMHRILYETQNNPKPDSHYYPMLVLHPTKHWVVNHDGRHRAARAYWANKIYLRFVLMWAERAGPEGGRGYEGRLPPPKSDPEQIAGNYNIGRFIPWKRFLHRRPYSRDDIFWSRMEK